MKYRYTLEHHLEGVLVVNDPIGWDQLKLKLERSLDDAGVFFVFTEETLGFWGDAKDYIKRIFDVEGVDAEISCLIEVEINGAWENLFPLPLELDMAEYEVTETTWSTGLVEEGTLKKLRTRNELAVQLNSTESLDGTLLASIPVQDVVMPGREVYVESIADATRTWLEGALNDPFSTLTEVSNEGLILDADSNRFFTDNPDYDGLWYVNINGIASWNNQNPTGTPGGGPRFEILADTLTNVIASGSLGDEDTVSDKELNFDFFITAGVNQSIYIDFVFEEAPIGFTGFGEFNGTITMFRADITPTYSAKGQMIFESLARVLQVITDQDDPLRSSVLGRTDALPHAEASDGEFSFFSLHTGLQLRGFPSGQGVLAISWKNLWSEGVRKLFNLGYEVDADNRIVIGKREDFFLNELGQTFDFVDYTEEPEEDYYYNEAETGYKKFFEEDEKNTRETVHTKQQWATALETIKNKLDAVCGLIADMYKITFKLRDRYEDDSTVSRTDDEAAHIIHVNRETVTIGPLTFDRYKAVQDEQATSVSGVFSPTTVYNLLITPKRILNRWLNVIAPSFWPNWGREVKFVSAQGNKGMSSQLTTEGSVVVESGNETIVSSDALYYPNKLAFETRMDKVQYDALWNDRKKKHRVRRDSGAYRYGYLLELEYEPEKALASIVLLETSTP